MEIIELQDTSSEWRDFLEENEHLIFHTPQYKWFIENSFKCKVLYLAAKEEDKIKTILPFFYVKHPVLGKKVISTAFLEYGGPAGNEKHVADLINYIYGKYAKADYIEVREGLPNYDAILSKLMKKSVDYKRFVLKLSSESEVLKNIDKQKKKALRKSENSGIRVKEIREDDLDEVYRLYLRNMRAFGSPPFRKSFFLNFHKYLVKNNMGKMFGSFHDGKLASVLVGFTYKDRIHIIIAVSDIAMREYRPNEAMHWYFIRYGLDKDYKFFDFGRVREDSGQYRFKKEWGCELLDLNHYYLLIKTDSLPKVDPNNPKYKLATKLWQHAPLFITKKLGPWLREGLGI